MSPVSDKPADRGGEKRRKSAPERQGRFTRLESKLQISFKRKDLLEQALTHASSTGKNNYERLEFLGDRVLGLAVADLLYRHFPQESEGGLAKRHASLVQGRTLSEVAGILNLGEDLILSVAERAAGGALNDHILADCVESLLGALYLDQGYEICFALIERLWKTRLEKLEVPPLEPKTQLQEWAQGRSLPLPIYSLVGRTGPDHDPLFKVAVKVEGYRPATAEGTSRRKAEKKAAMKLLGIIETVNKDPAKAKAQEKKRIQPQVRKNSEEVKESGKGKRKTK